MFYEKFLQLCAEKGVSKQKACQLAGLSGNAWIRWSTGSMPGSVSLQKICDYFGVTPGSMVNDGKEIEHVYEGVAARQDAFDRTEMRVLFDAAKDVPASKIYEVVAMLEKFKEESQGR